jgi:hypothetical protein
MYPGRMVCVKGEDDLEPLEPVEPGLGPEDATPDTATLSRRRASDVRVRGWRVATGALALALLATAVWLVTTRDDRDDLGERLQRAQRARLDAVREADELRRRTRLPAIDLSLGGVVLLPTANGMVSAVSVLIAPADFSKVWLTVDVVGAAPAATYGLMGGSCGLDATPPSDWVARRTSPAASVRRSTAASDSGFRAAGLQATQRRTR